MRQRLTELFSRLTTSLATAALHDAQIDLLIAWLTAIASSAHRPYRMTATMAALSMSIALATAAAQDASALVVARRQSVASKRRSGAEDVTAAEVRCDHDR